MKNEPIEMPGLDQVPDSYWQWLREKEMVTQIDDRYEGKTATEATRDNAANRLRRALQISRQVHDRLDRLETLLIVIGIREKQDSPDDLPKSEQDASLNEVSLELPNMLVRAVERLEEYIASIQNELS